MIPLEEFEQVHGTRSRQVHHLSLFLSLCLSLYLYIYIKRVRVAYTARVRLENVVLPNQFINNKLAAELTIFIIVRMYVLRSSFE